MSLFQITNAVAIVQTDESWLLSLVITVSDSGRLGKYEGWSISNENQGIRPKFFPQSICW